MQSEKRRTGLDRGDYMEAWEGTISLGFPDDDTGKKALEIEMWLNNEITKLVYERWGAGMRVHLRGEPLRSYVGRHPRTT